MIDRKAAITTAILIAITTVISASGGLYVYFTRSEMLPPDWLVIGHLLGPSLGIAMWLLMRRQARKFPEPQNLDASFKKHYGLLLVFSCAFLALMQTYFVARDLGMIVPSTSKARFFIAALGLFFVVFGNTHGKLPSPFKGHAEPFSWDKMSRFTGWTFVVYGFALFVGAFTIPARVMLPALIVLWSTGMALLLVRRRHLIQDKKKRMP